MKRIDAYGATTEKKFTNGSPVDGIPPTRVAADWLNTIQEELATVVESAGIELDQTGADTGQLLQAIQGMLSGVPVGSVTMYAGASIPSGWLECNGAALSADEWPELYAAIGNTYGGEGPFFSLPDARGLFLRGLDSGRGIDSGRALGSYQADELKAHTHSVEIRLADNNDDEVAPPAGSDGRLKNPRYTVTSSATGGTETRPKNLAMRVIIRAGSQLS